MQLGIWLNILEMIFKLVFMIGTIIIPLYWIGSKVELHELKRENEILKERLNEKKEGKK